LMLVPTQLKFPRGYPHMRQASKNGFAEDHLSFPKIMKLSCVDAFRIAALSDY